MKPTFLRPLLMITAALVLIAAPALAQGDASSIIDQLGLSDAQKAQVKELKDKFRTETEKPRTELKQLLEEEKKLKQASPPNETALKKVLHDRADREIELTLALTRFYERLEGILTPEQKKALEKIREDRKKPH